MFLYFHSLLYLKYLFELNDDRKEVRVLSILLYDGFGDVLLDRFI